MRLFYLEGPVVNTRRFAILPRMSARDLRPFAILAVVTLLPGWQFVFGGRVPAPVDQIVTLPPWNGEAPEKPLDILQLDGALQFLPWRAYMLDSFHQGEIPLWNERSLGGAPFLANSQSSPLYPLHLAWGMTPFSAEWLLSLSAWLHSWIAACGMFLLCRRLGGSEIGGLIGGSSVALSAFYIGWLQLPSVGITAAWIPWVLVGVPRLFDEPTGNSVAKLGTAIALMLLGGHLQIATYGLLAGALFAIWLAVGERRLLPFLLSGVSLLIGLIISSPQVLPSLENGREGHRAQPPTSEGFEGYARLALMPQHLATVAAPTIFGMPGDWVEMDGSRAPSYWLSIEEQGRNYAELPFYTGPIVVPLFFLGLAVCWKRPRGNFFLFLAAFALLAAMGTFVTQAMYWWIPGWAATGSPGRIAALFIISLCALAGAAFRENGEKPSALASIIAALLLGAITLYGFSIIAREPAHPMEAASQAQSVPWLALFGVGGVIAVAAVAWRSPYARSLSAACLVLGILVPAISQRNVNPGAAKGLFDQGFEGLEDLRALGDTTIAVVNEQWSLMGPAPQTMAPPNTFMIYGIKTLDGYDSLIPRYRKDELDAINGRDSAPLANGNMMFIKPGFDPDKLRAAGVTHVVSAHDLDLPLVKAFSNWRLYSLGPDVQPRKGLAPPTPGGYRLGLLLAMFGVFAIFALSCRRDADPNPA